MYCKLCGCELKESEIKVCEDCQNGVERLPHPLVTVDMTEVWLYANYQE
jgi:ribosome-binding protein aMBF1 (putative translation factor)